MILYKGLIPYNKKMIGKNTISAPAIISNALTLRSGSLRSICIMKVVIDISNEINAIMIKLFLIFIN